jgi:hypothetical protein
MWVYNKEEINVIDINELDIHELSEECSCKPKSTHFQGQKVIIHTCQHPIDEQTKRLFKDVNS